MKFFPTNRLLGLALLLGGLAGCWLGLQLLVSPTEYAATVSIKVDGGSEGNDDFSYDPYFIQTTYEIIQSDLVLSNVVANLNLNKIWGQRQHNSSPLKYSECYATIRKHLQFRSANYSRIIEIIYSSDNSKETADVANAIVESYQQYRRLSFIDEIERAIDVLQQVYQDQEKQLSLQLTNREQVLQSHKLLAEKIDGEKLNLKTPCLSSFQTTNRAQPPPFPARDNRPLGAVLLLLGLFPVTAGWLLAKNVCLDQPRF